MCYVAHPDENTVGVRELRQNLSVYLRRIRQGVELTVTERGVPVAILAPLPVPGSALAQLAANGLLLPARRPGAVGQLRPPVPAAAGAPPLSQVLDDLRDDIA